jgi:hypothetical protein
MTEHFPPRSTRLPKEDDTIRVRALEIVVHPPTVGGLRELLVVDENQGRRVQARDEVPETRESSLSARSRSDLES